MRKNICYLALFFSIAFFLSNCDDDSVHPKEWDESSFARRRGPIANAGADVSIVLPTNAAALNGSQSQTFDAVKNFTWSKIAGPASYLISDPYAEVTTVTSLIEGTYTFRLAVTDGKTRMATDDVNVQVTNGVIVEPPPVVTVPDDLYFQGNMDAVTISTSNGKLVFNGWDQLKTHPLIENFGINNIGGTSYAYQQITTDPTASATKAMYATILDDDPNVSGTTRAQMSLRFEDGVDLPVYHTSHRMYLNPDVAYMQNYSSSITWFVLFEIWNKHIDAWDGDVAGSARWGLYAYKDSGAGQPFYWVMRSEYMQPASMAYQNIWKYTNRAVALPVGKWFTLDMYMKRGEGTAGRLTLKITTDGEPTQVLFDIVNSTQYPGHPEIQLKSWQPFKLYLNDAYLDWMRSNGKIISAYYNDFKWYKN